MNKKLSSFKKEFFTFTSSERIFIYCVMLCIFFIAAEYSITRPASNSILISVFSTRIFPFVWLCTVPINFLVVFLYNKYIEKLGCKKIFCITGALVIAVNIFTAIFQRYFPFLIFFQFIWKDIYILLMFKQLWSMIHSTINRKKASYLYGIIFGMGGFGSIFGSILPGFFATRIGSHNLFFATFFFYVVIILLYFMAFNRSNIHNKFQKLFENPSHNSFSLVWKSKYLKTILFLVIFMQLSIALTDFQFNTYLESTISSQDLRTEFCGKIVGIINIFTTSLQLVGGFMLTRYLGLKKSHILVPSLIIGNVFLFIGHPSFFSITYSLIAIKSLDYSVFGIIREMLYLPLDKEGKFRAKAVIDVFAYRTSRIFASFLIISLQAFAFRHILTLISFTLFFLCLCWIFVVLRLFKGPEVSLLENK